MRSCKKCPYQGPPSSFPKAHEIKGVVYYRHVCPSCYQAQKRAYKHKQRKQLVEYKKQLSCVRCGFDDHRALIFHHIDPATKDFAIGQVIRHGFSMASVLDEIDKCEVLCANCHHIEHYAAPNTPVL